MAESIEDKGRISSLTTADIANLIIDHLESLLWLTTRALFTTLIVTLGMLFYNVLGALL
jgi:hypothetical protein